VEISPDVLEGEVHGVRVGEARRSAVEHVLEKMRDAVRLARLEARADAHPKRDVTAIEVWLRNDEERQPVRELLFLDAKQIRNLRRRDLPRVRRRRSSASTAPCTSRRPARPP